MNSALILHDKETAPSGPIIKYDFDNQWYGPVGQAIYGQTGVRAEIPELPHPSEARFKEYASIIDDYEIDANSTVIGHGFGAGIILRYLSERKDIEVEQVALVAPRYLRTGQEGQKFFYEDPDISLPKRIGKMSLLYSQDTSVNGHRSARRIERSCDEIEVYRLYGLGKCIVGNSMKSPDFPELAQVLGVSADEAAEDTSNFIPIQAKRFDASNVLYLNRERATKQLV